MSKRSRSLLKNTSILGFGVLCTKGIMFLMTPLFTRWLSSDDFGTFDLLVTYVTLLVPLMTFSIGESLFRFILEKNDESECISTGFVVNVIGILISIVISIVLSLVTNIKLLYIVSFTSYLIAEMLFNFFTMIMRGEKKLNVYSISNIVFVIGLSFFVFLFTYIMKMGLSGILFGYATGDFLSIFVICFFTKVHKKISFKLFSKKKFSEMVKYSMPMIPNSVSWWIVNVSDRTLISFFCGPTYNAIYAVANKLPSLCTTFFRVFHLSWQQNAIETLTDKDRDKYFSSVYNEMINVVGTISILILGSNFLFFKLFNVEYSSGYYHAPILILSVLFSMMGQFIGGIYVAQMKSKKNGFTSTLAAVINIIINLLLIKNIGLYAASISTFISYFILFAIRKIDINRDIKLKMSVKNYLLFVFIMYFFIITYINNYVINWLNIFLSVVIFVIFNFTYVKSIMKKIILRGEKCEKN